MSSPISWRQTDSPTILKAKIYGSVEVTFSGQDLNMQKVNMIIQQTNHLIDRSTSRQNMTFREVLEKVSLSRGVTIEQIEILSYPNKTYIKKHWS